MRFLVDECTGPSVARWLSGQGFDVVSIYDAARGAPDEQVIQRAHEEQRILITNDKDFGDKIHREQHPHCGVILLRLADERTPAKITALSSLLQSYRDRLPDSFTVVTETRVRFAEP